MLKSCVRFGFDAIEFILRTIGLILDKTNPMSGMLIAVVMVGSIVTALGAGISANFRADEGSIHYATAYIWFAYIVGCGIGVFISVYLLYISIGKLVNGIVRLYKWSHS
jgi:hypothetical protein